MAKPTARSAPLRMLAFMLLRWLLASGAGALLALLYSKRRVAKRRQLAHGPKGRKQIGAPVLDNRRKAAIASGRAVDHAGEVAVVTARNFDMNKTIFGSLEGALPRMVMRAQVGNEFFWEERATANIEAAFALVPKPPAHASEILDFMNNECNFRMEHADGSFMDHLQFCFEYGVAHYSQHSARVLFLHSIMGVGTNFFPMRLDQRDTLAKMLTPFEMRHVEAFPSVLRLLNSYDVIEELMRNVDRAGALRALEFHRVLDNAPLVLEGEDVWIHLNYQLVHLLDFLPTTNWGVQKSQPLFQVFVALFELLKRADKLEAGVDCDLTSVEPTADGLPLTLGGLIAQAVPSATKKRMASAVIARYSGKIGHSLQYRLRWDEPAEQQA